MQPLKLQRIIANKPTNKIKWNHKNTPLIFLNAVKKNKEEMAQIEYKYKMTDLNLNVSKISMSISKSLPC